MGAKFSTAAPAVEPPVAYFESAEAGLGVGRPSSVGPRLKGQQVGLQSQAEEVLLVVLAAAKPQAKGPMLAPRKPMAATRAVELAKLLQRPVTMSLLRWEGPSAVVGLATSIEQQAEARQAGRQVQRLLQVPRLVEQLLAVLLFEGLPLVQAWQPAEELQMSSVGAMRLVLEGPQRLITQLLEAG